MIHLEKFKCNIKGFYRIILARMVVDINLRACGGQKVQEERVMRNRKGRVGVNQRERDSFYLWGLRFKVGRPHSCSLVWKVIT